MAQYLEAPKVSVLRKEKVYKITTPASFNRTTKAGDEIVIEFITISGSYTVGSRELSSDGDGLSAELEWSFKELTPGSVIFGYHHRRGNERSDSECRLVPRTPF